MLDKEQVVLINLNTIAILNNTSIGALKNKLKNLTILEKYLININKVILNKYYIEEIKNKDLEDLKEVTNKYKTIYSNNINYLLI